MDNGGVKGIVLNKNKYQQMSNMSRLVLHYNVLCIHWGMGKLKYWLSS